VRTTSAPGTCGAPRRWRGCAPRRRAPIHGQEQPMTDDSLTYYGELDSMSLLPGWKRTQPAIWPTPRPKFKPAIWYFEKAKKALQAAGQFVSTEQAERRNLIMVNPIEGNTYATSRNLVAAYQMIMPGERARTHRHSPSALRLIVDVGPDTYTVVDGARIDMA